MAEPVQYQTSEDGLVAYLTLNRPEHYNAIDSQMPQAIRAAVKRANADPAVHCIVLRGAGQGFCGGYDLGIYAQNAQRGQTDGSQDLTTGYDPAVPTIAQVHGAAVAGGSDIALSCDLVVMADNARIGYPPSRAWGCPTTAMWAVRLGPEKAKRMLFTGDLISGKEAEAMGLVLKSVPEAELEETVRVLADRIKTVPRNQNWMHKQVINSFVEGSLNNAQRMGTVFDGITRNSPEGIEFQKTAEEKGFKAAIAKRDTPGRTETYRRVRKSVL
ncbi:Enoyl-CoA Hydratase family member [Colletotrichum karsti]|uniref:Enoyl-CoA Hydratase family member n=1 Tax=Colletotrichum karsti TaxID=1095194 RepID=A0A9P6I5D8_9PEZI|nr:Enoyl-CoA Hydratase family member [Colletotrichum karsti]KAF9872305.1 Enoyl-CoA Hydratase family member [Colletotrichum karsti]